jgi:predicted metal-dependent phosphoesterase TrpH
MALKATLSRSTQPAAQDTGILKEVWETVTYDSCPHHYNFHLHTNCSDGQLTPEALIEQAVSLGLKGMAITDHHSTRGYEAAQRWLDVRRKATPEIPLTHLWTGIEVTANLLDVEVHILGYGFDPQNPAMIPYLQGDRPQKGASRADCAINALHEAGALAVLAHPSRYHRPAAELIPVAAKLGIDGVEAYYAYGNPKPWQPSPAQTEQAIALSKRYGLLATCGTDTHGSNLLQRL